MNKKNNNINEKWENDDWGINRIKDFLDYNGVSYQRNFPILVDSNVIPSGIASLDFVIPTLGIAIEFKGWNHFRYTQGIHDDNEEFNNQVIRDIEVRKKCAKYGIDLITIQPETYIYGILEGVFIMQGFKAPNRKNK